MQCTTEGCPFSMCIAPDQQSPGRISLSDDTNYDEFEETFQCPSCYTKARSVPPYHVNPQGMTRMKAFQPIGQMGLVYLWTNYPYGADATVNTIRESLGIASNQVRGCSDTSLEDGLIIC